MDYPISSQFSWVQLHLNKLTPEKYWLMAEKPDILKSVWN